MTWQSAWSLGLGRRAEVVWWFVGMWDWDGDPCRSFCIAVLLRCRYVIGNHYNSEHIFTPRGFELIM
jgi:hypothetical protein